MSSDPKPVDDRGTSDDRTTVALLVGGSVGPEILAPVLSVLDAADFRLDFERFDVQVPRRSTVDTYLDEAIAATRRHKVALKTKFLPPTRALRDDGPPLPNPNVDLRLRLELFAGIRPIRCLRGLPTRYPGLDLILIRENSEDIYKGIEHEVVPGIVQSMKVVTRAACDRIARYAFRIAAEYDRKKLTFVHKGNIMKMSDGLFMRTVRQVAEQYPAIAYEEMIVDAACMNMVLKPESFDVILTGNLYGDILGSLGTGLVGGISTANAISRSEEIYVFEAIHGDAPALVGTGRANPLPLLMPALELGRHLGRHEQAQRVHAAVEEVLESGENVTPDLGGDAGTRAMCDAIVAAM